MIQAFTASTFEIDDPAMAAKEILDGIKLDKLKSNSLGILTCSTEFLETGAVKAVCEALPFDVIGCTTAAGAAGGVLGEMILTLMVLTSDGVFFSAGVSGSLASEREAVIEDAYRQSAGKRTEKPALVLAFAPFIHSVGGECIVECLNKTCGGLPVFGTLAIDSSPDLSLNQTIFNGESSKNALSLALLYGEIRPRFFLASVPKEKIRRQRGIITKSSGNILFEINNMPLRDYLKTLGLRSERGAWGTISFPFVIDYNDGTEPLARSIYTINDDGSAACGGFMPENAAITLGGLEKNDVLRSAGESLAKITEQKGASCLLMFGCFTRFVVLGADTTAEMEKIRESLEGSRDYQFCYSGGEICPVYTETGVTVNRFHNCSLIACLL